MKKSIKRLAMFLFSIVLLISAVGLVGCGGDEKLRVINYRPEDQKFFDWVIGEFKKENPGVNVVYEAVDTSGYSNLLNARLKAKAVDVFGAEAAYVGSSEMLPNMSVLNDLKAADGSSLWDSIDDGSKEECSLSGNYLVAPTSKVTMPVYYNKDIISAANGFTFENGQYPTTWSEFQNMVYKLKGMQTSQKIKGIFAYGGLESWPMSMIVSMAEVNTIRSESVKFYMNMALENSDESGNKYNFGHPLYRDFFEKLQFVCSYIDSSSKGVAYARTPANFALGGYAMMLDGSWSYNQMKIANKNMNVGFFPMPSNDDAAKNITVPYKTATGFAISKTATNTEMAKKFVEFQYRENVYKRYINEVCASPVVKGVALEDATAASMFSFDSILTSENMWIPGMEGTNYFREIGSNFIPGGKSYTVDDAVKKMNEMMETTRTNWTKEQPLKDWFARFYPEALLS